MSKNETTPKRFLRNVLSKQQVDRLSALGFVDSTDASETAPSMSRGRLTVFIEPDDLDEAFFTAYACGDFTWTADDFSELIKSIDLISREASLAKGEVESFLKASSKNG